ncbi:HTH domain-containing protein [Halomicroarcula sp. GCM10025709]|uniref:HTH domain-containing protein n=1 Tax=Haloarcula TaxID=2237 RepID=UPI0024C278D9|nr:HTH domain-containing protein [Halomicroarcula sp. YJ-61-S]
MEPTQSEGGRAELFVRSLLPEAARSHQQSITDRLRSLDDDRFSAHSVTVWGKQLPATPAETETTVGRLAHEQIAAFREWATVNDRSLSPAFTVRTVEADLLGERYRALVLPQVLLAEYEGDALQCVTPHASGDGIVSVTDRLAALEAGTAATFTAVERSSTHPEPPRVEAPSGTAGSDGPVPSE